VRLEKRYARLEPGDDVLTIGMNRALTLLSEPAKGRRAATPAREVGRHPMGGEPITLHDGRFGPYVRHGKLNASLPKAVKPEALTVEQAVQLLADRAEKIAQGGGRPARGGRGKAAGAGGKKTAPAKAEPRRAAKQPAAPARAKPAKAAVPRPAARKRP
jgi:DNA topoisomerase I